MEAGIEAAGMLARPSNTPSMLQSLSSSFVTFVIGNGTNSKNLFIGQYDKFFEVLVIPDIIAFTISGITDIIATSDISESTIGRSKQSKNVHKKIKKTQKIEDKCTPKIFIIKHKKKFKKMHPKNTKKNAKKHTKIAKITPNMPKMIHRG